MVENEEDEGKGEGEGDDDRRIWKEMEGERRRKNMKKEGDEWKKKKKKKNGRKKILPWRAWRELGPRLHTRERERGLNREGISCVSDFATSGFAAKMEPQVNGFDRDPLTGWFYR
ncbi:hypothetical protein MA16_Dca009203 [Dendrobium catenatum]|uniref:Uncharacterized protein n=1 Tax=Dendrobium catenatum TaxID=906689 RepID=A0A2I0VR36_9ASPA|nr:hypothetical protein MA16_Dca009203 [Dendrobium catenatum]